VCLLTANPLCSLWDLDVEELLDSQRVRLLVAHHAAVVEAIKVRQRLKPPTHGQAKKSCLILLTNIYKNLNLVAFTRI
jgi:hypothetical protein